MLLCVVWTKVCKTDTLATRSRALQLPAPMARGWTAQREAMLHKVTVVLGGRPGSSGGHAAGSSTPAANAGAVAAAERAMQELLVNPVVATL